MASVIFSVQKSGVDDKGCLCFEVKISGKIVKGILLKAGDTFKAYENKCMHLAIPLDLGDGKIETHDGKQLQCHMHGAVFEKESGKCVAGPCLDKYLRSFAVEVVGELVRVKCVLVEA